jgi:hypothetical protein
MEFQQKDLFLNPDDEEEEYRIREDKVKKSLQRIKKIRKEINIRLKTNN